MADYKFPLPEPDDTTQPFWDAAREHRLVLQRCTQCKSFQHPPAPTCVTCLSEDFEWPEVSGKGKIYSHIEVSQAVLPAFADQVPYSIVNVAPDDAPNVQIMGNVPGASWAQLRVGTPVQVTFDDVAEGVSIPRWKLV